VDKDVVAKINEMTKPGSEGCDETRPNGLDVALEAAAGEYAKSMMHKAEMALGLGKLNAG
jgi:hypothetical protein